MKAQGSYHPHYCFHSNPGCNYPHCWSWSRQQVGFAQAVRAGKEKPVAQVDQTD